MLTEIASIITGVYHAYPRTISALILAIITYLLLQLVVKVRNMRNKRGTQVGDLGSGSQIDANAKSAHIRHVFTAVSTPRSVLEKESVLGQFGKLHLKDLSSDAQVVGLFIYPIKSCGPISLDKAYVTECGFQHDRRFMIVHEQLDEGETAHRFITQRTHEQMSLIQPVIGSTSRHRAVMEIYFPSSQATKPSVSVPLIPDRKSYESVRVRVWRDEVEALDLGDQVAAILTDFLETRVRLVYLLEQRPVPKRSHILSPPLNSRVSFSDYSPYLLTSLESLHHINSLSSAAVPMSRFRPNIVVARTEQPFIEDSWEEFQIGSTNFTTAAHATRCKVTTINQVTGTYTSTGEPLATLRAHRTSPTYNNGVLFGINLVANDADTFVSVEDPVQVTQQDLAFQERLLTTKMTTDI